MSIQEAIVSELKAEFKTIRAEDKAAYEKQRAEDKAAYNNLLKEIGYDIKQLNLDKARREGKDSN